MTDLQQDKVNEETPIISPQRGLPAPAKPPPLIDRLKNEVSEVTKVTNSQIYFYYAQSHLIGRGASSMVFRGYYQEPEQKAAVKVIECRSEHDAKPSAHNELAVWEKLGSNQQHPGTEYILSCYGSASEVNILYVAMEMAELSLEQELLYNLKSYKDRHQIYGYLRNIAAGLECLHSHNIMHRDLKPQNILIVTDSHTGRRVAKLGDFGLSRQLTASEGSFSLGKGTSMWMAPEVLRALDEEEEFLNTKAMDIFSFGLVASYCMDDRLHPFFQDGKLVANIKKDEVTPRLLYYPLVDNLLLWMMQKDPQKRPSITQCRAHPFLWDEDANLIFIHDLTSNLYNKRWEDPDCALLCATLDATYNEYMARNFRTSQRFNWLFRVEDDISRTLALSGRYWWASMVSFFKFATDNTTKPPEEAIPKCSRFHDENKIYSQKLFVRYIVELYPHMMAILFVALSVAVETFPCLETMKQKYFQEFIGCSQYWTSSLAVKCLEIFPGELQKQRQKRLDRERSQAES